MIRRLLPWGRRLSAASIAPIGEFALRLLRTIVLSRLLAPDEFGIAMALVAVILAAELISDLGLDRYVMVAAREKLARHLAAAHAVGVIRGLAQGIVILALSPVLADVFGADAYWLAFAAASIIPVIRGFSHLGIKQLQRDYRFGPEAIVTIAAQLVALGVTAGVAFWVANAWAVLPGFVAEALVMAAGTHIAVGTRFRTDFSREAVRLCLRYAWPFAANGLALALVMQADRFLVGGFLGAAVLGLYAVIMSLSVTPVYAAQRVVGGVLLPLTISLRDGPGGIAAAARLVPWLYAGAGYLCALGLAFFLDVLTPLLFGEAYQVPHEIHLLAVLVAFFRFARSGPVCVFLVTGDTKAIMAGTLIAGCGLVVSLALVMNGAGLSGVMAGLIAGEIISFAVSLGLLSRHTGISGFTVTLVFLGACAAAAIVVAGLDLLVPANWGERFMLAAAFIAGAGLVVLPVARKFFRAQTGTQPHDGAAP
ncbi:MAG TPA: oligosaccharide flippase family protein [Micropepsaceae bacterium]|nr:oligosaccharide flippase family protein [Micropepsaceae bacterium]